MLKSIVRICLFHQIDGFWGFNRRELVFRSLRLELKTKELTAVNSISSPELTAKELTVVNSVSGPELTAMGLRS